MTMQYALRNRQLRRENFKALLWCLLFSILTIGIISIGSILLYTQLGYCESVLTYPLKIEGRIYPYHNEDIMKPINRSGVQRYQLEYYQGIRYKNVFEFYVDPILYFGEPWPVQEKLNVIDDIFCQCQIGIKIWFTKNFNLGINKNWYKVLSSESQYSNATYFNYFFVNYEKGGENK